MKKLYVLDASGYLFRSYFAIRNITNAKGESTNALFGFIRSILKLFKDFHPEYFVAVFDGPDNSKTREALYSEYKAHRSAIPGDLGYQIDWAREFCQLMGIPFLNIPGVEADDTMGSVAKWGETHQFCSYLCTSDKDLCQLVNPQIFILNTHKDNLVLGEKEVEENFGVPPNQMIDLLAMIGDSSDNVPGIPGFGPKTAAALLKQFGSLDQILQNAEQIPGKKKETLISEKDNALLSRKLVIIDTQVPIPEDLSFYQLKTPHKADLKEFYAKMSFNSLIRELEQPPQTAQETNIAPTPPSENHHYHLVDNTSSLNLLLKKLDAVEEICFDVETTHWQPLKADLVGFGFCVKEQEADYIPLNGNLGKEQVLKALQPLFANPKHKFYSHHIKYDLEVLAHHGLTLANISFDPILASYLLNSNSRQHSLEALALEYFGKVKTPLQNLVGKGKNEISLLQVPVDKVCGYCCENVDDTFRLKQILEKKLEEQSLKSLLMDIELPLSRVLAEMEIKGIFLDIPYLETMSKEIAREIRNLEIAIHEMAGETFNINSPKQLSHILFEKLRIQAPKKTATGLSTNAEVLEFLRNDYPIAEKLLEYRVLEKLRSTYVDALPLEVNPDTHRIHCNFNQTVAATGRLSCQDPNLQNIPIRTEIGKAIRAAFKPQKTGWSYLAADYSQIELRLLAHLSEDPHLIEAFNQHQDIHARTAATILNIPLEQVTEQQRYQAKAVNFGVIYGQQAFGLSQELGIDVKEAGAFIDRYFKNYEKVKEFIEASKEQARRTGKSLTMTARQRLLPEMHSKNHMIRSAAERLAVNTPLQGTAADLIKMAMLKIHDQLKVHRLQAMMILQIHDELLFEAPDEELPLLKEIVRREMEGVFKLKVPLIVNITIGKNWKEC